MSSDVAPARKENNGLSTKTTEQVVVNPWECLCVDIIAHTYSMAIVR